MQRKVAANMAECFGVIERHYLGDAPWVLGSDYSVADAYLFTIAGWLEGDGVDIALGAEIRVDPVAHGLELFGDIEDEGGWFGVDAAFQRTDGIDSCRGSSVPFGGCGVEGAVVHQGDERLEVFVLKREHEHTLGDFRFFCWS